MTTSCQLFLHIMLIVLVNFKSFKLFSFTVPLILLIALWGVICLEHTVILEYELDVTRYGLTEYEYYNML